KATVRQPTELIPSIQIDWEPSNLRILRRDFRAIRSVGPADNGKAGSTMASLTVLRERTESERFARLRQDDARTAIPPMDAEALAADLKKAIRGEVRFDKGTRALYS